MSARSSSRIVVGLALSASLTFGSVSSAWAVAAFEPPSIDRPAPHAPIEAPGPTQIVVYDRASRTSTVVSHDRAGRPGTASSSRPSISADGGLVAFESDAPLVTDDTNGRADIYLWDRASDATRRVTVGRNGGQPNGASHDPSISGDGSLVAFSSTATNLTRDTGLDGSTTQVFAWQAAGGGVSLVSAGASKPGSGRSGAPSVSRDGRIVAFESAAANLVAGDTNDARDVFLRDLGRGATIRASVDSAAKQVGAESRRPSLSGDGGIVAFDSTSGALVRRDTNGEHDVFVRDLPPAVQVTPDAVDFGVVALGTPASQTLTVVSVGWTPVSMSTSTIAGSNPGDFVLADDACAGQALPYGLSCAIVVLHVPTAPGPRNATLSIADSALDSPQEVSLVGGVPAPQIRLDPVVGPPGIVTMLTGSNYPPGALVTVRWNRGISQPIDPVVVNPDGTFAVGVLVFHHDRLGPRQLLVGADPTGPSFDDDSVSFLVVPAPVQPPGTSAVTFAAPELRLVLVRR